MKLVTPPTPLPTRPAAAIRQRRWRQSASYQRYLDRRRANPSLRWSSFLSRAKQRSKVVSLTKDGFCALVQLPCWYCGASPPLGATHGVDRWDNSVGYTADNSVPCCATCNSMKYTHTEARFLQQAARIVQHELERHVVAGLSAPSSDAPSQSSTTLAQYRARSAKKGLAFELSPDDFRTLRSQPCAYCRATAQIGIDRRDNTRGYTAANSFPACKNCNLMKKDFTYERFFTHCWLMVRRSVARAAETSARTRNQRTPADRKAAVVDQDGVDLH